ncbi:MAG: hypothetical protein QXU69_11965 [Thermofilaceae archaeon]
MRIKRWVVVTLITLSAALLLLYLLFDDFQKLIWKRDFTLDVLQGEILYVNGACYVRAGSVLRVTIDLSRLIQPIINELEVRSVGPGIEFAEFIVITPINSTSGRGFVRVTVDPDAPPRTLIATLGLVKPVGLKFEVTAFQIRAYRAQSLVLSEDFRFVVLNENELQTKRQEVQIRHLITGIVVLAILVVALAVVVVKQRKRVKEERKKKRVIQDYSDYGYEGG